MLLYISYSTPECRLHMYVSRAARRLVVLCFSSAVSWVMSTYTVQPVTNSVIPPHPTWHGVVVDNERWTESEVVSSWVVSVLLMCCWCVGVRWRGGNTTLAYWVASVDHQSWPVYCWQSVSLHWASTETWGLLHAYTDIQYTAVCLSVCRCTVHCIAVSLSLSVCVCCTEYRLGTVLTVYMWWQMTLSSVIIKTVSFILPRCLSTTMCPIKFWFACTTKSSWGHTMCPWSEVSN